MGSMLLIVLVFCDELWFCALFVIFRLPVSLDCPILILIAPSVFCNVYLGKGREYLYHR